MKPIPAYKGKELNELVDRYMEDGINVERDILTQGMELAYIQQMRHDKEVRMSREEMDKLYELQNQIRDMLSNVVYL